MLEGEETEAASANTEKLWRFRTACTIWITARPSMDKEKVIKLFRWLCDSWKDNAKSACTSAAMPSCERTMRPAMPPSVPTGVVFGFCVLFAPERRRKRSHKDNSPSCCVCSLVWRLTRTGTLKKSYQKMATMAIWVNKSILLDSH